MIIFFLLFIFSASMFSLEMSTTKNCETKKLPAGSKHVVVINFQCSVGEGVVRKITLFSDYPDFLIPVVLTRLFTGDSSKPRKCG